MADLPDSSSASVALHQFKLVSFESQPILELGQVQSRLHIVSEPQKEQVLQKNLFLILASVNSSSIFVQVLDLALTTLDI